LKYINFTFSLFFISAISSCSTTEHEKLVELDKIPDYFNTIQADNSTTFSYPSEMLTTENLKYESKFQFSDLINVQYVVLQEDNNEEGMDLKSFSIDKLEELQQKMIEPSSNKLTAFELKKINGYETVFEADTYGWSSKLVYWISVVELKHKFITTIAWTTIDRIKKFQKDAALMVKSFR
jgi:hypothetical protein